MYPHPYPLHILILNILDILKTGLKLAENIDEFSLQMRANLLEQSSIVYMNR